jgi:Domain of unknown function (DUF4365)
VKYRLGAKLKEAVLHRNNRQGWYGECFVQLLAAAAGFGIAKPQPDVAGIDLHIVGLSEIEDDYPLAKIQVKSWSAPEGDDRAWNFRGLTEKQFNVLAGRRTVPVFLFLVVVPPNARDYAHADSEGLQLCYAAYWKSLANEPKIPNASTRRKVRVAVPRENLLTVESLTTLCAGSVAGRGSETTAFAKTS